MGGVRGKLEVGGLGEVESGEAELCRQLISEHSRFVLLPNAEHAVIDDAKVRGYLVSSSPPVGRFVSAFFAALGFSDASWELLRDGLLAMARSTDAVPGQVSPFGQKFEVRGNLRGPSGREAEVVTVWLVLNGRDFAHFVTAFPGWPMFNLLDTLVLDRDLPEHGLRRGDLGAVVDVLPPDGLEVEFVLARQARRRRWCPLAQPTCARSPRAI